MKSNFWGPAITCAFVSLIVFMEVLEKIFYPVPRSRVQTLGYQVASILALVGIAGTAIGIKILKKKQILAGILVGFFFGPVVWAIVIFIFGA